MRPNKYFKFFITSIVILLSADGYLMSQNKKDFELLGGVFEPHNQKLEYSDYMKGNSNEFQFLASGFFLFYKSFISSQDGNHCVFYPSCSVYTIQSIKKNGLLIGIADGMDRLSRCNLLSPGNYAKYGTTNLLLDPVWDKHEQ